MFNNYKTKKGVIIEPEQLYNRYAEMVFRRCNRLLKNEALAVDAMQDVFVTVLTKKSTLDLSQPSSLLYRMATNISLNIIRSKKRELNYWTSEEDALLVKIASLEDVESQIHAIGILNHLFKLSPESSKTIAVLFFVDGLPIEEVATTVSMSVSGVRKRLKKLRSVLQELDGIK